MFKDKSVAKKYAVSLFDIAKSGGLIEEISDDILYVKSVIASNSKYGHMMLSKCAPYKIKSVFIKTALSGRAMNPVSVRFLEVLLHHNRIGLFGHIAAAFEELILADRGIRKVRLTVSQHDPEFMKFLQTEMEGLIKSEVRLNAVEDKSILGGFIMEINNTVIDCSLRCKLQKLRKLL